jgi:hypothetical protein
MVEQYASPFRASIIVNNETTVNNGVSKMSLYPAASAGTISPDFAANNFKVCARDINSPTI